MSINLYKDLSAPITPNTVRFDSDPYFICEPVKIATQHYTFALHKLHMCNHIGTHIDFPAHIIEGGKTSSDYAIDHLIGFGVVVEVPFGIKSISKSFVDEQPIFADAIVFFKTSNSNFSKNEQMQNDFVYIEPDAAKSLVQKKVRIVGIDYVSVDAYSDPTFPVHSTLLSHEILIIENLELKNINAGAYKIFIAPLPIPNMDGLPARVVAFEYTTPV